MRERENVKWNYDFIFEIHGYYITSFHLRNNFYPPKNYSILANWQHRLLSNSNIIFANSTIPATVTTMSGC